MSFSGDYRIDALLQNAGGQPTRWSGSAGTSTIITYAFNNTAPNATVYGTDPSSWIPLNGTQRDAERRALQTWADASGIILVELPDHLSAQADINISMASIGDPTVAAYAYYPNGGGNAGLMVIDRDLYANSTFAPGSYEYMLLLHETGHALGFKHPFDAGVLLPSAEQKLAYTVMAYDTSPGPKTASLGVYDQMAVKYLYGARDAAYSDLHATYTNGGFNITGNGWSKYLPGEVISVKVDDGRMVLSDHDVWFKVERLYEASFNRDPTGTEMVGWVNYLEAGHSLHQLAQLFLTCGEMTARYGNLSNEGLLNVVYQNLLDRAPDAPGKAAWLQYLQQTGDRAGFLASTIDCPEAYARSDWNHQSVFMPEAQVANLNLLWHTVYGDMAVSKDAFNYWLGGLQSGQKSMQTVAREILNTAPSVMQMSDHDFMQLVYQNANHRGASQWEADLWINAMHSMGGGDRAWIVAQMPLNLEPLAAHDNLYHDGVIYA